MGFFDDLTFETKSDIVDGQRESTLQQMYVILIRLGINPESFDPSAFEEQTYSDPGDVTNQEMLVDLISRTNLLDQISSTINSATPSS